MFACLATTALAAELSWQLHIPESLDEALSQPAAPEKQSLEIAESLWRSEVICQLLAKNFSGAQQSLNTPPTQDVPVSLLTSRASWLLGLGLVPWAEHTLEEALRHSSELDSTQAKQLQSINTSLRIAYATQQSETTIVKELSEVLPALLAINPSSKPYQQWQVLEGPDRLSIGVQLQRQQLAMLAPSKEASPSVGQGDEPVFPASLKPSLAETIKTLKASQRVLNNAAGVVDIGLHQRRLTPIEYNHQCAELIDFLTQQQQRVAQYKGRLERQRVSVSSTNAQQRQWENALNESVALITLHEAAIASLREAIEAPYSSALSPTPAPASVSIAKQLPDMEAKVLQQWQTVLNRWEPLSVSQAFLEMGLPLSFAKALPLDTSRAVRVLTTQLPAPIEGIGGKKGKAYKTK